MKNKGKNKGKHKHKNKITIKIIRSKTKIANNKDNRKSWEQVKAGNASEFAGEVKAFAKLLRKDLEDALEQGHNIQLFGQGTSPISRKTSIVGQYTETQSHFKNEPQNRKCFGDATSN